MDAQLWKKMTEHTPLSEMTNFESHPNLVKLEENIWVIKNFISEEDRMKYINFVNSLDEEEWWKKNRNWWVGKYLFIEPGSELASVSAKLSDEIRKWVKPDVHIGAFGSIHRLLPDQGMFIHTDNPTEVRPIYDDHKNKIGETEGKNNYCIMAMVVYLSEFKGGNLFFPMLDFEYHGQPGDLVFFPGTGRLYDHGVRKVQDGPARYIITGFGYDEKVKPLKESKYVFEDPETGENSDIEPDLVNNDPEEAMKLPPRNVY